MKKTKPILIAIIAFLGMYGGVKILANRNAEEQTPVVNEEKKETPNKNEQENKTEKEDEKQEENKNEGTTSKDQGTIANQVQKEYPNDKKDETPTTPTEVIPPNTEEEPTIPEEPEKVEDLRITNDKITNGVYQLANKKYNTITIAKDVESNAKIILDNVEVKEKLILENPGKYQLDISNTTIPFLYVKDESTSNFARTFRSAIYKTINKALNGATINIGGNSQVEFISISNNVEINGDKQVATIEVNSGEEVVLNIPSKNVIVNGGGFVAINQNAEMLLNQQNATLVVNAPINTLTNAGESSIRINGQNTIANFNNKGENTIVAGSGKIENATISANNTQIYVDVTNKEIEENTENILIRQEETVSIVDIRSTAQGSVTFTLSSAVDLSIKDLSVICNAGKSITLFRLTTTDQLTYTLSTSYFKNDSYALYLTLPNGNIISKDFATDYANPTVENVVTERISDSDANLKLYGIDEGGKIYYLLEEAVSKEAITKEYIKEKGNVSLVKVGFNNIPLTNLKPNVSYRLYYVLEGYFENTGKVNGPIEIESQEIETTPSKYEIVYAKEEISNRFVFKLNHIPERELTLNDFEIDCPSDSSLTIKEAKFYISPDLLTYIIEIPNNYGHKDNEYTVRIKISDTETIEKDFVTHLNPPVITGAVDNVKRITENTIEFKFNSDEAGTVYYGIYEWNGGIYDYNSTTPFASDVLTGKINSKSQKLNAGENTITMDLSGSNTTNNTRLWALYVDEVGNYRVGFVEHYKIPEYIEENPTPENTLQITNMNYTNNSFAIEFSEEVLYNITQDDVKISVVKEGSLPSKLMLIIDNSVAKKVNIEIGNYTLPVGEYQIEITATNTKGEIVKLVKQFEIKETIS